MHLGPKFLPTPLIKTLQFSVITSITQTHSSKTPQTQSISPKTQTHTHTHHPFTNQTPSKIRAQKARLPAGLQHRPKQYRD